MKASVTVRVKVVDTTCPCTVRSGCPASGAPTLPMGLHGLLWWRNAGAMIGGSPNAARTAAMAPVTEPRPHLRKWRLVMAPSGPSVSA